MTIFRYQRNREFSESDDDCEAEHNRLVRQKSSLRTVKKAEGSLVRGRKNRALTKSVRSRIKSIETHKSQMREEVKRLEESDED